MSNSGFECRYTLDQRPDSELVRALESAAFAIQATFENGRCSIRLTPDGLPAEPAEAWIIYLAALTFGAAQSLVTLVLHNFGREARIVERAMYEYFQKAVFYANDPKEAALEFYALPFRDLKLRDQVGYDKDSQFYRELEEYVRRVGSEDPELAEYATKNRGRERDLASMVEANQPEDAREDYAFHYRVPSQTPHASILGLSEVLQFKPGGGSPFLQFNSQQVNPNLSLLFGLKHITDLMVLMEATFADAMPFRSEDAVKTYSEIARRLFSPPDLDAAS